MSNSFNNSRSVVTMFPSLTVFTFHEPDLRQVSIQESSLNYFTDGEVSECVYDRLLAYFCICLAVFMLSMIPLKVHAASYSLNGTCYGDQESILAAFKAQFPIFNDLGVTNIRQAYFTTPNVIIYEIDRRAWGFANPTLYQLSGITLQPCTSGLVSNGSVQNMISIALVVLCFLFGFYIGKNHFNNHFSGGHA